MKAKILASSSELGDFHVTNEMLLSQVKNFNQQAALNSLLKKNIPVEAEKKEKVFAEWVKQVCGVESRPFMREEVEKKLQVEKMAFLATKKLLAKVEIDKKDIDQVIFSTYSSNRVMPSPACTLINFLELPQASAVTMNGACSGFLDALIDAVIKVESGHFKTILVVAAEQLSNKLNFEDPKSSIIFSDGAGAFLVSQSPDSQKRVLSFASGSTFSEQVYMERDNFISFNSGPLIERNAIKTMLNICEKSLQHNLSFKDIDYVVPHQANLRIINEFEKKIYSLLKDTKKKPEVIKSIKMLGNLSSASVPVAFDLLVEKKYSGNLENLKGKKVLFVSVGGGYTYSSLIYQF